jgi:hypothetical protein
VARPEDRRITSKLSGTVSRPTSSPSSWFLRLLIVRSCLGPGGVVSCFRFAFLGASFKRVGRFSLHYLVLGLSQLLARTGADDSQTDVGAIMLVHSVRDAIPVWIRCSREKRRPVEADFVRSKESGDAPAWEDNSMDSSGFDLDLGAGAVEEVQGEALVPICEGHVDGGADFHNQDAADALKNKQETWQEFNSRMNNGAAKFARDVSPGKVVVMAAACRPMADLMGAFLDARDYRPLDPPGPVVRYTVRSVTHVPPTSQALFFLSIFSLGRFGWGGFCPTGFASSTGVSPDPFTKQRSLPGCQISRRTELKPYAREMSLRSNAVSEQGQGFNASVLK